MKTYDLDLHLFNKVNKHNPTFCGAICAPCYVFYRRDLFVSKQPVHIV